MRKVDLAYTAGIIDGEGCIHIRIQHDKRYNNCRKYGLNVQVSSTDEWLCQWLHFAWGGSIRYATRDNPKWRPYWAWQIVNRQALVFLETILPYLHLKRPQAEIAIAFQKRQRWGVNITPEISILNEADRIRIQELKRLRQAVPK